MTRCATRRLARWSAIDAALLAAVLPLTTATSSGPIGLPMVQARGGRP